MKVHRMLMVVLVVVAVPLLLAQSPDARFSDWSEPVNLGDIVNSTAGDFFAGISKDGLSLYFTSNRDGGYGLSDIYVSRRESIGHPWGTPENLGGDINTASNESSPFLDGHRMYFATDRPGGSGGNDIYVARLSRRHNEHDEVVWGPPENLGDGVNSSANESHPTLFKDETTGLTTLYFDSNRPGGPGPFTDDVARNGNDIYSSTRQEDEDETFGPAALVVELSTAVFDRHPSVRRDGLEMFLSSNRGGTLGFLDLWVSTRETTWDKWSQPVNLGAVVNGPGNEAGPALDFRGTTLYFQGPGADPSFRFDLFVTTREKLKGRNDEDDK